MAAARSLTSSRVSAQGTRKRSSRAARRCELFRLFWAVGGGVEGACAKNGSARSVARLLEVDELLLAPLVGRLELEPELAVNVGGRSHSGRPPECELCTMGGAAE